MLKALRKVKESTSISGQDAEDKKHLQEIRDATLALQKTFNAWYKSFSEFCTATANVHRDVANLYPANQNLANSVMVLNGSNDIFASAQLAMNELKASVEAASNELVARTTDLISKANERAFARAEIEHYKSKIVNLANEGLQDAKKQAKAESNQVKLADNQQIFRRLDDILTTSFAQLDSEIAHLTSQPLETFLRIQTDFSHSLNTMYTNAIAEGVKNAAQPAPAAGATFRQVIAGPVKIEVPTPSAPSAAAEEGASSQEVASSEGADAASGDCAAADETENVTAYDDEHAPETNAETQEEEPAAAVANPSDDAGQVDYEGEPAENAVEGESGEYAEDGWSNHSSGNPFAE